MPFSWILTHATAFSVKGIILAKLRRYEEAFTAYGQALKLHPTNALTLYHRGLAFAELGRHEEALATFEQSLRLDPTSSAYYNKGLAHAELDAMKKPFRLMSKRYVYILPTVVRITIKGGPD